MHVFGCLLVLTIAMCLYGISSTKCGKRCAAYVVIAFLAIVVFVVMAIYDSLHRF